MIRRYFMRWPVGWKGFRKVGNAVLNVIGYAWRKLQNLQKREITTTLSISPLKNAEKINEIGEALAEIYGVKHLPSDFKKKNGYKRSIELSHDYGLYRQNYCGCVFSKREQEEKMKQKQISEGSVL